MTRPRGVFVAHSVDPAIQLLVLNTAHDQLKHIHEVEVRTLRDRIDDLIRQLAEARARPTLADVNTRMAEQMRDGEEEEEGKEKENPLRRANPVQWVMDSLEEQIPLSNQNARNNLQSWVTRQVRLRGPGSLDDILAEALLGDVSDDNEDND